MNDLSNIHENDKDPSGNLLGPQEKHILEQIAAGGPPHSQRAQSLLAIDASVTQKIAALQSGQTVGQVSYWLSKFRRDRMGIFPEELLLQTEPEPTSPQQLTDQLTPSEGSEIDQQVEQDVRGEDSISPAAETKPEQIEGKKVKSKPDKASKKVKKEKKSPAAKAKPVKKGKTKKKKDKASKKKKKGKKTKKSGQTKKTPQKSQKAKTSKKMKDVTEQSQAGKKTEEKKEDEQSKDNPTTVAPEKKSDK